MHGTPQAHGPTLDSSGDVCVRPRPLPVLQDFPAPAGDDGESRYKLHRRFDRLGRLYGDGAVEKLMNSRVVIFGLGGVGGFAAEALARSAVGNLTLVDFDDVCVTNTNRQLQALRGNIGKSKAEVLRERLQLVNPQATFTALREFYKAERADALLGPAPSPEGTTTDAPGPYDFVVDCIDNLSAKANLLAACKLRGIPVVSSMGAAGKVDPTQVRVADLARTRACPMAYDVRKILRKKYSFAKHGDFGIRAVFSEEPRSWPRELTYDEGLGFRCVCPKVSDEHSCESRSLIDGTTSFVTGTFGLVCASEVVNTLVGALRSHNPPAKARQGTQAPGVS